MTAREELREVQDAALNALEAGVTGDDLTAALNAVIRDYQREVLAAMVGDGE